MEEAGSPSTRQLLSITGCGLLLGCRLTLAFPACFSEQRKASGSQSENVSMCKNSECQENISRHRQHLYHSWKHLGLDERSMSP